MIEYVIELLNEYRNWAILISITINIVIAVMGVVPSYFITAANLVVFGFWMGAFISFVGESLGAIIAFVLYRKGFRSYLQRQLEKYPKAKSLIDAKGKDAFIIIISLRLLPFMPSGIVTFGGAVGQVSLLTFALASSLGKIPALMIEAFAVYQVTQLTWVGKVIIIGVAAYLLYYVYTKRKQDKTCEEL
ncbi:TVP38/TMEM64 family protein [Desulfuribacillus alkaliarsenatis]|uniref:TVP38/TMEM64 family membrane protein n=1 Tax=Desulfuribacillus alkaliarsenatis TaxID=766136 RepID=A0A1E5G385_9FIRM|nr:VTT domain-containing protein [Desulfuribacillus alkaliarsenatis]OEF97513.1 hypothetical protein BHF68_04720 [Desulfuribacillus alkaliarsenatis]